MPDSEPDRRQWLREQSRSRRRRRSSSAKGKRSSSSSSRGRSAAAAYDDDDRSHSRESSLAAGGGDDDYDSDASSVVSAGSSVGSTNSRLSIVSTPEVSSWRQRQMKQQHQRVKSSERAASVSGFSTKRNSLSSSSLSGLQGFAPGGGGGGGMQQPRGSLSRTSSSSSISSMLSSSLLRWCNVCEAEFTRLRRPHRCRRCLEAVCAPCSPARLPVPGSGSADPKRTCKLCARESLEPQVDAVVSPQRRPRAAVAAASPAGSVRSRSSQRRSASMGSIARVPFGVLSKPADPVLYPAPGSIAGSGAGDAGSDDGGDTAAGSTGGGGGGSEADFGLGTPAAAADAAYFEAEDARHDSESEHWESAEEGDGEDWPSVAAMAARIENPAAENDATGSGGSSPEDAGREGASAVELSGGAPRETEEEGAPGLAVGGAPSPAVGEPASGSAADVDADGQQGETPLAAEASTSSGAVLEAGREAVEPPPAVSPPPAASVAGTSSPPEKEEPKRGIFGLLFGRQPSKAKIEVSDASIVIGMEDTFVLRALKRRCCRGSQPLAHSVVAVAVWGCNFCGSPIFVMYTCTKVYTRYTSAGKSRK